MLCDRVSVFLTEQFPRPKDSLGLAVLLFVLRPVCVVLVARMLGAQFRVTTVWPQPYFWQCPRRNPRESVRRGFLSLGADW